MSAAAYLTADRRRAARDHAIQFLTTEDQTAAKSMVDLLETKKPFKRRMRELYASKTVQLVVAFLIFTNFSMEILDAQLRPKAGSPLKRMFESFDLFFIIIFTFELIWNMYGHWFYLFWSDGWNVFDFIIVAVCLIGVFTPHLPGSSVTFLRLFRAFRVFRLFKRVHSLRKIIEGVIGAIPGIMQVFIVIIVFMGNWSVIGVTFFEDAMPRQFGTFTKSMYTLFEVMFGDWTSVSRELMWTHKYDFSWVFFLTYIFIIPVVMFNVIVAVLLDKYLAAMDNQDNQKATQLDENFPELFVKVDGLLKPMCKLSWGQLNNLMNWLKTMDRPFSNMEPTTDTVSEKQVVEWSVDEVCLWLQIVGFKKWIPKFKKEKITGADLMQIDQSDLKDFGMYFGQRKKFNDALLQLLCEHTKCIQILNKMHQLFQEYDTDNDGYISKEELIHAFQKKSISMKNVTEDFIEDIFNTLFHSGEFTEKGLSFEDFRNGFAQVKGRSSENKIIEDGTSAISPAATRSIPEIELSSGWHGHHAALCKTVGNAGRGKTTKV